MPGRRGSFPPNCFLKVAQFTVSAASYVPSQIRVCEYEWMQTRLLALIVAESVVLSRSVAAVEVITPTDRQTVEHSNSGESFDLIRFSLPDQFFRFDLAI